MLVSRRASMNTTCGSRHPEATARSIAAVSAAAGHGAVREQDLDQGAGSGGVAAGPPGGVPIGLMRSGERAAGFRLGQRGRAG